MHRAVHTHHEDALAGHQRCRADARVELRTPRLAFAVEHQQPVVGRDHGMKAPIAADAGRQRRARVQAPQHLAALRVQRQHRAVAASDDEVAIEHHHGQRKLHAVDLGRPDLPRRDLGREGFQRLGLGFVGGAAD